MRKLFPHKKRTNITKRNTPPSLPMTDKEWNDAENTDQLGEIIMLSIFIFVLFGGIIYVLIN